MGYSGLKHPGSSDNAAGVCSDLCYAVVKVLKKALKLEDNEFNTDGVVNVALIFEAHIIPSKLGKGYDDDLLKLANKTLRKLNKLIDEDDPDDWIDSDNRKMHLDAYRRMRRKLKRYIETWDD